MKEIQSIALNSGTTLACVLLCLIILTFLASLLLKLRQRIFSKVCAFTQQTWANTFCPCKLSSLSMFSLPNRLCCKSNKFARGNVALRSLVETSRPKGNDCSPESNMHRRSNMAFSVIKAGHSKVKSPNNQILNACEILCLLKSMRAFGCHDNHILIQSTPKPSATVQPPLGCYT